MDRDDPPRFRSHAPLRRLRVDVQRSRQDIHQDRSRAAISDGVGRGDKGDGIPNIFSPSDTFVRELRQKPITQKIIEKYLNESPDKWNDGYALTGFYRNETLIDLRFIPKEVKENIINTYEETKPARGKLLNYFIQHKLKNLIDVIEEF